jgi:predicted ATPase
MAQLVEREFAEQKLAEALASARQGVGRTVLAYGEAGIGKTSLIEAWAQGSQDVRWLWGGCEALYSPRPLGPLFDMATGLDEASRRLLTQEGGGAELFSAVLQQLQEPGRPTIMVIEDLHWADAATLDLVKFLARRIHRTAAVLVLTFRDDEVGESHPLRGVLGDLPPDALIRIPLAPLSQAGVAVLARRASRPAEGLFAATGGNPFFVTEAIRGEGLPASVRDAVLARATRQPPGVRAILELSSLVPGRIEAGLVDAILAPSSAEISSALSSGLLVADARGYAFRHELARIAVEQALPAPLAAALHGRLLAALQSGVVGREGVAKARLVHHAAGANNSRAVLELAPQAAEEAVTHRAHREAASLYAIALSHAGGLPPRERAVLLEQRAYRCYMTDQLDEAISARLSALVIWRSLGEQEQEGRTLRWLSRLSWFIGRGADAERYADEAVRLLQSVPPGRELAWALSNRAGEPPRGGDRLRRTRHRDGA